MKFWMRLAVWATAALLMAGSLAKAEVSELVLAGQYGISFLPYIIMEDQKLIEKHAEAAGVKGLVVKWNKFGGGNVMNDALLSGNLHIAAGGIPPFITLWARAKGNGDVKAICALSSLPVLLNTRNPNVKTAKDFTNRDKIALPAVKVSTQSVILQMFAEKEYGPDQTFRFDPWTVAMSHPDGHAALMSGAGEITAHMSAPPFQLRQLEKPGIHTVLNSNDVLGGPTTFNLFWTTSKFHDENPKVYAAFVKALEEATEIIKKNKKWSAETYLRISKDKDSLDNILNILNDPSTVFTTTPQNFMKFATFMHKIGSIKTVPATWKDLFFPEAHNLPGS